MTNEQKIAWYEYQIADCGKDNCPVCARYETRISELERTEIPKKHRAMRSGALAR